MACMDKPVTKQELIEVLAEAFVRERVITREETKKIVEEAFEKERIITDQKFTDVIKIMNDGFESLQHSIDKNEGDHDRRITRVEDRVRVVKNVIERDLNKTVAW